MRDADAYSYYFGNTKIAEVNRNRTVSFEHIMYTLSKIEKLISEEFVIEYILYPKQAVKIC